MITYRSNYEFYFFNLAFETPLVTWELIFGDLPPNIEGHMASISILNPKRMHKAAYPE